MKVVVVPDKHLRNKHLCIPTLGDDVKVVECIFLRNGMEVRLRRVSQGFPAGPV